MGREADADRRNRQEDLDAAYAELERRKNPSIDGPPKRVPWPVPVYGHHDPVTDTFVPEKPYTVAGPGGERVLVTWEDIKAIMDRKLYVGQIKSRQGDGSRPYAVFSKRECAAEIAEMINRRFNSTMGEK